jgi:hypothetical protein
VSNADLPERAERGRNQKTLPLMTLRKLINADRFQWFSSSHLPIYLFTHSPLYYSCQILLDSRKIFARSRGRLRSIKILVTALPRCVLCGQRLFLRTTLISKIFGQSLPVTNNLFFAGS